MAQEPNLGFPDFFIFVFWIHVQWPNRSVRPKKEKFDQRNLSKHIIWKIREPLNSTSIEDFESHVVPLKFSKSALRNSRIQARTFPHRTPLVGRDSVVIKLSKYLFRKTRPRRIAMLPSLWKWGRGSRWWRHSWWRRRVTPSFLSYLAEFYHIWRNCKIGQLDPHSPRPLATWALPVLWLRYWLQPGAFLTYQCELVCHAHVTKISIHSFNYPCIKKMFFLL